MDVLKSLDEEKIKVSSISVSDYDVRIFVDKGIEVLIATILIQASLPNN